MIKNIFLGLALCTAMTFFAQEGYAATYYVDFDSGTDSANGTTTSTPWRHAPGDANAAGVPATIALAPGDIVQFKGGVAYRGTITMNASGALNAPITYKGTGWGQGQAILSGQDLIQLTFGTYTDDPRYTVAALPFAFNYSDIVTIDGTRFWLSGYPANVDPYWLDNDMVTYPAMTQMSGSGTAWTFTDTNLPALLSQLKPETLSGILFRVWGQPNVMYNMHVVSYDTTNNLLSLQGSFTPYGTGYTGQYHLFNHPSFIVKSDQYALLSAGTQLVAPVPVGLHDVEVSRRGYAINTNGRSYVTIDGFTITGYAGDETAIRGGVAIANYNYNNPAGITVINNNIVDLASWYNAGLINFNTGNNVIIRNNRLGPVFLNRGLILGNITNLDVENNVITKIGRSGMFLANNNTAYVRYNRFDQLIGTHGDGIAIYDVSGGHNQNVFVENNQFTNANLPITFEGNGTADPTQPNKLTIRSNVISNAISGITSWGGNMLGVVIYGNISMINPAIPSSIHPVGIRMSSAQSGMVITNNVTDDLLTTSVQPNDWVVTNNLLTSTNAYIDQYLPAGNTPNTALRPTVLDLIATGGQLPASICNVIAPSSTTKTPVGIDYYCQISSTNTVVNGACGGANNVATTSTPTTNLCSTGTATGVTGTGPWAWSCTGANGGATASCSAPLYVPPVNGACGAANNVATTSTPTTNLCSAGTATNMAGTGPWTWSCAGTNGGTTSSCSAPLYSAPLPINGQCGTAAGISSPTKPATNLCKTGLASSVTNNKWSWLWTCNGLNGGTGAKCMAPITNTKKPGSNH